MAAVVAGAMMIGCGPSEVDYDEIYEAAQAGDPKAQYMLGLWRKTHVPSRTREAFEWFLKAAEGGEPNAMYQVAICYNGSSEYETDYDEAEKWFTRTWLATGECVAVYQVLRIRCEGGHRPDELACMKWLYVWHGASCSGSNLDRSWDRLLDEQPRRLTAAQGVEAWRAAIPIIARAQE
jgi:hypothetical protein